MLFLLLSGQTQTPTTGSIAGTVVNTATGRPVAGARVKLTPPDVEADPLYTRADAEGRFEFANLNPASYALYAQSREPVCLDCRRAAWSATASTEPRT